jgi:hypothetical protein
MAFEIVEGFFGGFFVLEDIAFEPPGEGDEELVAHVCAGWDGDFRKKGGLVKKKMVG